MRQRMHCALQNLLTRVADGVNGVTHTVDQALVVERLAVEQLFEIGGDRVVVRPVAHVLLQILKHLKHLDVCAAVLGTLERSQRRRDRGIGVGAGGGDNVGRKGGVVAAAVLHMQDQRHIEHLCLQVRVLAVGSQQRQDHLSGGHGGLGVVYIEALVAHVMVIGVVAVDRQQREHRNQLYALSEHIVDRGIVGVFVVAEQRQHTARDRVHHIVARRLEDHVAHKVLRQGPVAHQKLLEGLQLRHVGQLAEQQQIHDLFKAKAVIAVDTADDIVDVVAAVIQLAVARNQLAVNQLVLLDGRNIGQSGQNALAVKVAQTSFDVVFAVQIDVDLRVFLHLFRQYIHLRCNV